MEYKREDPKVRFTVPDKVTVRKQLEYVSTIASAHGTQTFTRLWDGARLLIEEWECELIPDIDLDLDEMHSFGQTSVIIWAGNMVRTHVDGLSGDEKN